MQNFFSVFDLPPAFDIDLSALEKRYFEEQRRFHPDRTAAKTSAERQQSALQSMLLNEAYEALKHPLTRAQHLLALRGITVGSERDSVKPSHALLMDIMELREALEEADSKEAVEKVEAANAENIADIITQLRAVFASNDYTQAAQLTIQLGYLIKAGEEIRIKKKGLSRPPS